MGIFSRLSGKKRHDQQNQGADLEFSKQDVSEEGMIRLIDLDSVEVKRVAAPVNHTSEMSALASDEKIFFDSEADVHFEDAARLVIEKEKGSVGILQRQYKVGFNRAIRIMDQLEKAGVVGPEEGTMPRRVLLSIEEFEARLRDGCFVFPQPEGGCSELLQGLWDNFEKIEGLSQEEISEQIRTQLNLEPNFNVIFPKKILSAGNVLVSSVDYDTPLDFAEQLFLGCDLDDARIVLIDTMGIFKLYDNLPQLFLPVVEKQASIAGILNYLCAEQGVRREKYIQSGVRDYQGYLNHTDNNEPVLLVVIRELYDILQDSDVYEALKTLLPVCNRFGIAIIAFSMYSVQKIPLEDLSEFFNIQTASWAEGVFSGDLKAEEIADIDAMSGIDFENYCAQLLKNAGFSDVFVTKASGDYGGDILATKDQIQYVIQCKRYDSTIGIRAVQEVIASRAIYKTHVGAVMTNMSYSSSAKKLAEENNILLWDREDLKRMQIYHERG